LLAVLDLFGNLKPAAMLIKTEFTRQINCISLHLLIIS